MYWSRIVQFGNAILSLVEGPSPFGSIITTYHLGLIGDDSPEMFNFGKDVGSIPTGGATDVVFIDEFNFHITPISLSS